MDCVNSYNEGVVKHAKKGVVVKHSDKKMKLKDRMVSLFVFTSNTKDCIANSELRQIIKDEKIALSLSCVKRILMGYGAMNWRINKARGLKCLRLR